MESTDDRIVVEVHAGCASDHKRAKLSCSMTVGDHDVDVNVAGHDGRDPDDGCAADLVATCESPVLAAGDYIVHFRGDDIPITLPSDDATGCAESNGP